LWRENTLISRQQEGCGNGGREKTQGYHLNFVTHNDMKKDEREKVLRGKKAEEEGAGAYGG